MFFKVLKSIGSNNNCDECDDENDDDDEKHSPTCKHNFYFVFSKSESNLIIESNLGTIVNFLVQSYYEKYVPRLGICDTKTFMMDSDR